MYKYFKVGTTDTIDHLLLKIFYRVGIHLTSMQSLRINLAMIRVRILCHTKKLGEIARVNAQERERYIVCTP